MRLNPDCVRDVLLYLEENLVYIEEINTAKIQDISWRALFDDKYLSSTYLLDDIKYAIQKLHEIHFIECSIATGGRKGWLSCEITNLTWQGHEFLDTVRSKSVWDATKEKASKLGGMSVRTLGILALEISKAVATNPLLVNDIVNNLIK